MRGTGSAKPVELEALAQPSNPLRHMVDYYEACLELFAAVCASQSVDGRNMVGGRHGGWATYDCLLMGMGHDKLPARLRVRLTRLMRKLYVERRRDDYTAERETTQLLHEIDSATVSLPGPRFEMDKSFREYRPLKSCVLQVFPLPRLVSRRVRARILFCSRSALFLCSALPPSLPLLIPLNPSLSQSVCLK